MTLTSPTTGFPLTAHAYEYGPGEPLTLAAQAQLLPGSTTVGPRMLTESTNGTVIREYRSRLATPKRFVTAPGVAPCSITLFNWAGVRAGFAERIAAATPAASGADSDVSG